MRQDSKTAWYIMALGGGGLLLTMGVFMARPECTAERVELDRAIAHRRAMAEANAKATEEDPWSERANATWLMYDAATTARAVAQEELDACLSR